MFVRHTTDTICMTASSVFDFCLGSGEDFFVYTDEWTPTLGEGRSIEFCTMGECFWEEVWTRVSLGEMSLTTGTDFLTIGELNILLAAVEVDPFADTVTFFTIGECMVLSDQIVFG